MLFVSYRYDFCFARYGPLKKEVILKEFLPLLLRRSISNSAMVSDRRWITDHLLFLFFLLPLRISRKKCRSYMNGHWANLCILTLRFSTFTTLKRLKILLEWNKKHIQDHDVLYSSTETLRKKISRHLFIFFIRDIWFFRTIRTNTREFLSNIR